MCLEFVYKLKIKWKHNVYACLRDASNKDENITYIRERAKLEKMLSDAMGKETKKNGNDGREHQHTTLTHWIAKQIWKSVRIEVTKQNAAY